MGHPAPVSRPLGESWLVKTPAQCIGRWRGPRNALTSGGEWLPCLSAGYFHPKSLEGLGSDMRVHRRPSVPRRRRVVIYHCQSPSDGSDYMSVSNLLKVIHITLIYSWHILGHTLNEYNINSVYFPSFHFQYYTYLLILHCLHFSPVILADRLWGRRNEATLCWKRNDSLS